MARKLFKIARGGRNIVAAALALILSTSLSAPASAAGRADPAPAWLSEVRSVLDLPRELEPGEFAWREDYTAQGPLRIFVDLETDLIHLFRGGSEVGRARIIHGATDHPTPLGTYRILEKRQDHVSNIYNAPMPYMMRLTWDGVAIHATDVEGRLATHGCVGVPEAFAARLFAEARLGTEVAVRHVDIPPAYLRENDGLNGLLGLLSLRRTFAPASTIDLASRP